MKIRKAGKREYGCVKGAYGKKRKQVKNEIFSKFNQTNNQGEKNNEKL